MTYSDLRPLQQLAIPISRPTTVRRPLGSFTSGWPPNGCSGSPKCASNHLPRTSTYSTHQPLETTYSARISTVFHSFPADHAICPTADDPTAQHCPTALTLAPSRYGLGAGCVHFQTSAWKGVGGHSRHLQSSGMIFHRNHSTLVLDIVGTWLLVGGLNPSEKY